MNECMTCMKIFVLKNIEIKRPHGMMRPIRKFNGGSQGLFPTAF